MELSGILSKFGLDNLFPPQKIGSGHINETYLVKTNKGQKAILQKINTRVFKRPETVMTNLMVMMDHLRSSDYPYPLLEIHPTQSGELYFNEETGCWRVLSFLDGKEASLQGSNAGLTKIVAEGYGNFFKYMATLETSSIEETIPDFHNPEARFQQFIQAVDLTDPHRLDNTQSLVDHAMALSNITIEYINISKDLPLRITHGDAKASNILVDNSGKYVVGVIDLDTVMPGYFMNDFGDMVRSMCNTKNEDENELSGVILDITNFQGISTGFLQTMHDIITQDEFDSLLVGVRVILYEQFIRFLTDYLNGNVYYSIEYPEQNLNRAKVHLKLLIDYQSRENEFIDVLGNCLSQLYK